MRVFARPGGIERLSLEARVVYSVFCVFMLVGYGTSVWLYVDDDLGATPRGARTYYLGDAPAAAGPAGASPAMELPADDLSGAPLRLAKPPRQVVETFHFHLFSVAVCLLVLAHLFMLCGLRTATKVVSITVSSAATLLHILAPPLIRFVSPAWAVVMFPSALVMGLGWLVMTLWPLGEMWLRLPPRRAGQGGR